MFGKFATSDLVFDRELTRTEVEPAPPVEGSFNISNVGDDGSLLTRRFLKCLRWE